MNVVALIPARAGSKRAEHKNIRPLRGHPALAYTIAAAKSSGVFADVIVSTDAPRYAEVARHYGASVPFLRPAELSGDLSPDIEWISYTLKRLADEGKRYDAFSILRPTSPLRQAATIKRAFAQFCADPSVDSLRAVEKCKQHPGKMWVIRGNRMTPLMPFGPATQPWHSTPYQALPEVYVQNASLEIAWTRVITERPVPTIAGETVMPFVTEGFEGFDVNDQENWLVLERVIETGEATLPVISTAAFLAPSTKE